MIIHGLILFLKKITTMCSRLKNRMDRIRSRRGSFSRWVRVLQKWEDAGCREQ